MNASKFWYGGEGINQVFEEGLVRAEAMEDGFGCTFCQMDLLLFVLDDSWFAKHFGQEVRQ